MAALFTTSANDDVGDRRGEMFRRDGGCGRGPQTRELDRIHQRENAAVRGIEQAKNALDGRQTVAFGIAGKVGVDLRGEDGPTWSSGQPGRLHMESATLAVNADDCGAEGPVLRMRGKRCLYGCDAVRHAEHATDVALTKDDRPLGADHRTNLRMGLPFRRAN